MAYSQRFNRTLIVETDSTFSSHFKDSFAKYFTATSDRFNFDAAPFKSEFDNLSVAPHFLNGHVNQYPSPRSELEDITFNFSEDYMEQLLVHHQEGRQKKRNALYALANLKLNADLVDRLQERLQKLGPNFAAFHVRATDYQTDYKMRVARAVSSIAGSVFLATDNRDVVAYFVDIFGKDRLFHLSSVPEIAGQPLHFDEQNKDMSVRNQEAILDLFTLALSGKYFFFPRLSQKSQLFYKYSGFSRLAARLRATPTILRQVLPSEWHDRIAPKLRMRDRLWRYF